MNFRTMPIYLCLVSIFLNACSGLIPTPEPQDPNQYLDNALNWIQSHAVYGDRVNWEVIRRGALVYANNPETTADTYPAIRFVLSKLHDGFASLDLPVEDRPGTNAGMWVIGRKNVVIKVDPNGPADRAGIKVGDVIEMINGSIPRLSSPFSAFSDLNFGTEREIHITLQRPGQLQPIEVIVDQMSDTPGFDVKPTGKKLGSDPNGVGYIELPSYGGYPFTYPGFGHEVLRKLDRTELCGWIIDIRRTGGGDIWSYLATIGTIMGEGDVGGFAYLDGTHEVWGYNDGKVFWAGNDRDESLVQSGIYHPKRLMPPVALLISQATSAAGELVIVAFEGRDKVRTFGETTDGLPTLSIHTPLSDGAHIYLSGAYATDRNGNVYKDPFIPDETVKIDWAQFGAAQDPVILAALEWLMTQPECKN
jgi:carboxyl-terminal processing protease